VPVNTTSPLRLSNDVWFRWEHSRLWLYHLGRRALQCGNGDLLPVVRALAGGTSFADLETLILEAYPGTPPALINARLGNALSTLGQGGYIDNHGTLESTPAGLHTGPGPTRGPDPACQGDVSYSTFVQRLVRLCRPTGTPRLGGPVEVAWELTYQCDLDCLYCYRKEPRSPRGDEMTRDRQVATARRLGEAGVLQVALEGGEPLLAPHLLDVCAELKRHRVQVLILTNGGSLAPAIHNGLGSVLDWRVDGVQVSVDGPDEAVHDRSRGAGSFQRLVAGLAEASRARVPVVINMVVHRGNLGQAIATYDRVRAFECVRGFKAARFFRAGKGRAEDQPTAEEVLPEFADLVVHGMAVGGPPVQYYPGHIAHLPGLADLVPPIFDEGPTHCGAARSELAVDADGGVYPCHLLIFPEFRLGTLPDEEVAAVWESPAAVAVARGRAPTAACHRCPHRRLCPRRCMGQAYAAFGTLDAIDPNCPLSGFGSGGVAGEECP
jgi:pyrroloquinoline quinone biosynthesis protein E